MTIWNGINTRVSAVSDTPGVSELQINTRLAVEGELQRRWGNSTTSLAKQSGPILGISSAYPSNNPFVLLSNTGGTLEGLLSPHAEWDDPKLHVPTGSVVPSGCTPTQTITKVFTWNASAAPTDNNQTFTILDPGVGCCYSVTYTVTNALTPVGGGGPHDLAYGISDDPAFGGPEVIQTLMADCVGTPGNSLDGTCSAIGAPAVVTGTLSTSFWIALHLEMGVAATGANTHTYNGTTTCVLTIAPNHPCTGC